MSLFAWLDDKNKREKVAFIAGGFAAVVVAAWTVFTFIAKDWNQQPKQPIAAPSVQPNAIVTAPPPTPDLVPWPKAVGLPRLLHDRLPLEYRVSWMRQDGCSLG